MSAATRAIALLAALLLASACGGSRAAGPKRNARVAVSDGWIAMGTFFEADLRVRPEEVATARTWLDWVRVELPRLEAIYSRHAPTSRLSALNGALADEAVITQGTSIDPGLAGVLAESIDVWRATGGAFDVTVGPLVALWQRAAQRDEWPSVESIRKAKARVGSDRLTLTGEDRLVVSAPRLRIDLDAVSKGAALDRIAEKLEAVLPDAAALLSFGQSSTVAIGDPDGEGWLLAVRSRGPQGTEIATLRLRDRAVSVSSSLGSTSEIAGQTVSHIIDPRTGATVEGTVEAVVVAERAMRADGWSTGLLVLGARRSAIRLVEQDGVEAFVFDYAGRTVSSAGWEALLAQSGS